MAPLPKGLGAAKRLGYGRLLVQLGSSLSAALAAPDQACNPGQPHDRPLVVEDGTLELVRRFALVEAGLATRRSAGLE
ncbi:hypothetical protein RLEG12_06520 (plasmid) [Rhizobium leguminosarum bv. trifolii CB782]|nr:hypothetical protein RLEG12_06520 [Rhizobium leguminosarum bv. trifolii CB782]